MKWDFIVYEQNWLQINKREWCWQTYILITLHIHSHIFLSNFFLLCAFIVHVRKVFIIILFFLNTFPPTSLVSPVEWTQLLDQMRAAVSDNYYVASSFFSPSPPATLTFKFTLGKQKENCLFFTSTWTGVDDDDDRFLGKNRIWLYFSFLLLLDRCRRLYRWWWWWYKIERGVSLKLVCEWASIIKSYFFLGRTEYKGMCTVYTIPYWNSEGERENWTDLVWV